MRFVDTFVGSFYALREYPRYAERPFSSAVAHYLLLIFLASCLYAAIGQQMVTRHVDPLAEAVLNQIPTVAIEDGRVKTDLEQPYGIFVEGEPVALLDTRTDPEALLAEHEEVILLGSDRLYLKSLSGEIRIFPLEGDWVIDQASAREGWALFRNSLVPILLVAVFGWQVGWKLFQALLVAFLANLIRGGRPPFSVCLRLALYALSPAVAFGLAVFWLGSQGVFVPLAGVVFWGILLGVTLTGANLVAEEEPS